MNARKFLEAFGGIRDVWIQEAKSPAAAEEQNLKKDQIPRTAPASARENKEEPRMVTQKIPTTGGRILKIAAVLALVVGLAAAAVLLLPRLRNRNTNQATQTPTETAAPTDPTVPTETAVPTETDAPTPTEADFGDFYEGAPINMPHTVLAVLYNEPWKFGIPGEAEVWNEGEADRLYLNLPRAGITVSAYRVSETDGVLTVADQPTYSTTAQWDCCVVSASLERPEGGPVWYVEARDKAGRSGGILLNYNGNTGTPPIEFVEDGRMELSLEPALPALARRMMERFGEETYRHFWRTMQWKEICNWDDAGEFFSEIVEDGTEQTYVRTDGGEFQDGACTLQVARLHRSVQSETEGLSLEEAVQKQYDLFHSDEHPIPTKDESEELTYSLTGISVFNKYLAAKEVEVLVNGESQGVLMLRNPIAGQTGDGFCTPLYVRLEDVPANKPITLEVRVKDTYFGRPEDAVIEVHAGVSSNLSGAWSDDPMLAQQINEYGEEAVLHFMQAAGSVEDYRRYHTAMGEFGDSAAFTWTSMDAFENGSCGFRSARIHSPSYERILENNSNLDLAEAVRRQYELYQEIGNELGILGPGRDAAGVDLTYQLTGVTVFNTTLAAKRVEITVEGESIGTFELSADRFCTLIPVDVPEVTADHPVQVTVRVTETWFGDPEYAVIEAYGGLDSNISGAL